MRTDQTQKQRFTPRDHCPLRVDGRTRACRRRSSHPSTTSVHPARTAPTPQGGAASETQRHSPRRQAQKKATPKRKKHLTTSNRAPAPFVTEALAAWSGEASDKGRHVTCVGRRSEVRGQHQQGRPPGGQESEDRRERHRDRKEEGSRVTGDRTICAEITKEFTKKKLPAAPE